MCQPRHNGVAVCGRTLNGLVIDSRSVYKWRTYAAGVVLCQIDVVGLNLRLPWQQEVSNIMMLNGVRKVVCTCSVYW